MTPYYEEAGITIYHGDCREILPQLGRFDLLLTDPPYGIGEARNKRGGSQHGAAVAPSRDYGAATWDDAAPAPWVFGMMQSISTSQIIFGGNYFPLPPSKCWLVWDKENGNNGYADCELAWTNLNKAVRRINWRWMGMLQENMESKEERVHPTQKPLGVMKWTISQAPDDVKTIIDPYCGSGTTLVAAKDLGLTATGIELEERYCEIAANRLRQSVLNFEGVA
jgi:DNA modification methylase